MPFNKFFFLFAAFFYLQCLHAGNCTLHGLTLKDAECITMENNNDIKTLQQLVGKAIEGRLEAVSKWFPEIVLISAGYRTEKRDAFTGVHSAFLSQFNVTQALFSTEKFFNLRISSLTVQQLKLLLQAITIDVLYELRTAYYRVVLDCLNIETAKTNIDLFSDLAEMQESKHRIGTSILLNVNQSLVNAANATKDYYDAVKQLKIDRDNLVRILGYDPGTVDLAIAEEEIPIMSIPELSAKVEKAGQVFTGNGGGLIFKKGFPETQEILMNNLFTGNEISCWENLAIAYRPTLRSQAANVKIASEVVGKKQGEYLPEVNLEFNYGGYPTKMLDNPSGSFFNQNFDWGIGYRVNWLLFDGFGREHRIRAARYEKRARQFEYNKAVQAAYADVRRQIFDIEDSVANYVTSVSSVKLAEETVRLAKNSLDIGYINVFDYQIVVDGFVQAMYTRDEAKFDLIKGYFGLIHASGADLIGGCVK
jgi:outer membrane protein TolC